jgi:hypothetical protein
MMRSIRHAHCQEYPKILMNLTAMPNRKEKGFPNLGMIHQTIYDHSVLGKN